ncbi:MAG TPA: ATP-binding cassette domain-containing protein [Steroidobacteraceae bacterium]|nr:ATP-binding cassette domain-containing protein [Steroidobacteraceae bacterium]
MTGRLSILLHAVSVRRGRKWVLRHISWRLKPGERWALLGDNGAGKTQLLKLLSGDVWPTPGGPRSPRRTSPHPVGRWYRMGRRPMDLIDAKSRIAYVGAELQDKYARYGWNLNVRDLVATGLHRTDLLLLPVTPADARRVTATVRACGLLRHAGRKFLSLSYGQKRLALLARALVQHPDWLLLDEFYNGLDAAYRRRIDAVLAAARRRGQSWVATAHRALDVPRGTRRMLELAAGEVHVVRRVQSADLERLRKRAGEGARQRTQANRGWRVAEKAGTPGTPGTPSAPVLVRLARVDLFVDYRAVLRKVDWQLREGEHWAIYGANGSGKSSLLKLLYGDLSPASGGRIERSGFPKGTPIAEWKRQVGYVSPELQSDYAVNVTVSDLVASGRYASIGLVDEPTAQDLRVAARWLRFFGLLSVAKSRPRELSYGQLRRALIARAMAAEPRILLLDEPLTGLDPKQRAVTKRLLERLMMRVTLIIAVHHAEDLPRGMTHELRLHNRRAYAIDFHSAT